MPQQARSCYETAHKLFERISEPYSIGQVCVRLARLAPSSDDRRALVASAWIHRRSWVVSVVDLLLRAVAGGHG